MPPVLQIFAAIIGAIMSGASILATDQANQANIANARQILQQQQQYSSAEAEKAQDRSIQMYKNFFSPGAMYKQYEEAGLSPGLIYAKGGAGGSSSAGAQATTPSASVPLINPIIGGGQMESAMNVISTMTQAKKTTAETTKIGEETENLKKERERINKDIEQMNANIKLLEEKANTEVFTQANLKLTKDLQEIQKDFEQKTLQERIDAIKKSNDLIDKQIEQTWEETQGIKTDNANKQNLYDAQIDLLKKQKAKLGADIALETAQEVLATANALLATKQREKVSWEAKLTEAKTETERANYDKQIQEYYKAKEDVKILEEKVKDYQTYGAKVMESKGGLQTMVGMLLSLGKYIEGSLNE